MTWRLTKRKQVRFLKISKTYRRCKNAVQKIIEIMKKLLTLLTFYLIVSSSVFAQELTRKERKEMQKQFENRENGVPKATEALIKQNEKMNKDVHKRRKKGQGLTKFEKNRRKQYQKEYKRLRKNRKKK